MFTTGMEVLFIALTTMFASVKSFSMHEDVNKEHTLILFGFSGMRWDAMEKHNLPALNQLRIQGVHVAKKHDPFQTESLPAFVTLSTGHHPDEHGMLSNKMIDTKTGYSFDMNDNDPKWWKDVKPIWIQNQRTDNKSALCYWPGHHVTFNGRRAEYTCDNTMYADPFRELTTKGEITKEVMSFEHRLDRVKYWLTLTNHTERPSFIAVYFEEPLKTMMKYGVKSNETREAYQKVNNVTQRMMEFLDDEGLRDKINFAVTGEAAALDINEGGEIFLNDYLHGTQFFKSYKIVDNGPITTINPTFKDGNKTKELIEVLTNKSNSMDVYDGRHLPQEFHFTNDDRTLPIILVANKSKRINLDRSIVPPNKAMLGYHGKNPSTHSLFLARGPAFKESVYFPQLANVDIYNVLCKALKIQPDKNCGNEDIIKGAFRDPKKWYVVVYKNVVGSPSSFTVAVIIALVLLFTALYLIILSISKATERCRWTAPVSRKLEVFTPKPQNNSDKKHLLKEEEDSDISDLEEDLHFQLHKEIDTELQRR